MKDEHEYKVKVTIQSYMLDMKAAHLYLGVGGAYCDVYTCSKQQCSDVERIEGGFEIIEILKHCIIYSMTLCKRIAAY